MMARVAAGESASNPSQPQLQRQISVAGAVLLGMGAILGSGVFVSLWMGVTLAGPWALAAVAAAAALAVCNGLSSAQLAANHPVSGGTYEYGYRLLTPSLGFMAGWFFLCAKSASAATAALAVAGAWMVTAEGQARWLVVIALITVALLTGLVLAGVRRSNVANAVLVGLTLLTLALLVGWGVMRVAEPAAAASPAGGAGGGDGSADGGGFTVVLQAAALIFVAYTGYGRIATMGEEIREPRRSIPRAMVITLALSALVYMLVTWVLVRHAGRIEAADAARQAAPLPLLAEKLGGTWLAWMLALGATAALLGVLLNLILGLSRIVLAMGRRGDLPAATARLNRAATAPWVAVLVVGAVIAALVLIGDVRATWSLSALTVLIYYALTNAAALCLPDEQRLYPRSIAVAGLVGCLLLAAFVPPLYWAIGGGVALAGLAWHAVARRLAAPRAL